MLDSIIGIKCSDTTSEWISSCPTPEAQLQLNVPHGQISKYEDYELDPELLELVKGKRIAFVCPSPHLEGQGMGELIDSYDLVVRVNQGFTPTEDTWSDYGKRVDILVNCLNINKLNALRANPEYVKTLKYILAPQVSLWDTPRVDKFLESTNIPHQNVSDGYLFKIFKEVGTTVNTGLTGIMTLLNYPIEEIYVTGMTFFNMNKMGKIYHDEYHDQAAKFGNFSDTPNKEPLVAQLRMDIHAQQPQIDYFRKIVELHYPKPLSLDDYLLENFVK
tara:strand:+ start:2322 stop:3146 length:825 start_codon:yes stop_codon:yes gene_type:complete